MNEMFSFRQFWRVMIGTLVILLLISPLLYLAWRYRIRQTRISVELEDVTTGEEQQVDIGKDDEQPVEVEVESSFFFRLKKNSLLQTIDQQRIAAAQSSYLRNPQIVPKVSSIQKYQLDYEIQNEIGEYVPVRASVYVPVSKNSNRPWFVFGAGTSGLEDHCAPSREKVEVSNIGNYENQMISQAAQDFVVIFPDYEGFDEVGKIQPYFVSEMEARVLLGAAVAFQQATALDVNLPQAPRRDIFFSGYSQGGHAALSAASREGMLPSSLRVKGVVTYASAHDIVALLAESPRLAPYIARSYAEYYQNFPLTPIFQEKWLGQFDENTEKVCIDHIGDVFANVIDELYTPEFASALRVRNIQSVSPEFISLLNRNMEFPNLENIPIMLLQGKTDPIVTAQTQQRNRQKFCQGELSIFYKEYENINHYQTRQAGFMDSTNWMNSIHDGQVVPFNCQ
jgi:predicted esterase